MTQRNKTQFVNQLLIAESLEQYLDFGTVRDTLVPLKVYFEIKNFMWFIYESVFKMTLLVISIWLGREKKESGVIIITSLNLRSDHKPTSQSTTDQMYHSDIHGC